MNDPEMHRGRSRLQSIATAMAASVFLLPALLGKAVEVIYKGINPEGIDVSVGLAYLGQLLLISWSLALVWLVVVVVSIVVLQRREGWVASRLPWIVFGVQIVLAALYIVLVVILGGITAPA